jgi:hypothetical protein
MILRAGVRGVRHAFSTCAPQAGAAGWMKNFYKNPTESLGGFRSVFQELAVQPQNQQVLSGPASFSTAWFLSHAFQHVPLEERISIFYDTSVFMNESNDVIDADGQLDTILRAFYLMNDERMDAFLQQHVDTCIGNLNEIARTVPADEKELVQLNQDCIQSLLPPAAIRRRAPIWSWTLPAFDVPAFESEVLSQPFPTFGCTRHTFLDCHRLKYLHANHPTEYDRQLPLIASSISGSIHDSLWSVFFASGQQACVFRLVDMAACSFERYQQLRPTNTPSENIEQLITLMKTSASNDIRSVVKQLPTKNAETIIYIMSGLSACWSLTENAATHPRVDDILSSTLTRLRTRSEANFLTAEEARACNILHILATIASENKPASGCP